VQYQKSLWLNKENGGNAVLLDRIRPAPDPETWSIKTLSGYIEISGNHTLHPFHSGSNLCLDICTFSPLLWHWHLWLGFGTILVKSTICFNLVSLELFFLKASLVVSEWGWWLETVCCLNPYFTLGFVIEYMGSILKLCT